MIKFDKKNCLIYGLSDSGVYASILLDKVGAFCHIYDDNDTVYDNIAKSYPKYRKNIAHFIVERSLDEDLLDTIDIVVVSPAVPIDNKYISYLRQKGKIILSEMELGCMFSQNTILAVTGTNGKTTTVKLINDLLNTQTKSIAVGNIGYPVCRAVVEKRKDIYVVEVSSFMLENEYYFRPHIGAITNIAPDHLDRHGSFENYYQIKLNMTRHMLAEDIMVVNLDERYATDVQNMHCHKVFYSQNGKCEGAYVDNEAIYYKNEYIMRLNELCVKGKHNYYNILCAICFAKLMGISNGNIKRVLQSFKTPEHRCEYICEYNGITYINDSKSTTPHSTINAIQSYDNVVLILGGSDKNLDFSEIFEHKNKISYVVAYGETKHKIYTCALENAFADISVCETLGEAFTISVAKASSSSTILFSPACASFDQYKNYEQRGEKFKELVNEYVKKK